MATKVALGPFGHALAALYTASVSSVSRGFFGGELTHAIRTFLGNDVFGSLTLTNANWMRPSENSSTRSSSSPSALALASFSMSAPALRLFFLSFLPRPLGALRDGRTAGAVDFEYALLSAVMLERADERGSHNEDGPLGVCWRRCLGSGWRWGIDYILVAAGDVGAVAGRVERGHGVMGVVGSGDAVTKLRRGGDA